VSFLCIILSTIKSKEKKLKLKTSRLRRKERKNLGKRRKKNLKRKLKRLLRGETLVQVLMALMGKKIMTNQRTMVILHKNEFLL